MLVIFQSKKVKKKCYVRHYCQAVQQKKCFAYLDNLEGSIITIHDRTLTLTGTNSTGNGSSQENLAKQGSITDIQDEGTSISTQSLQEHDDGISISAQSSQENLT